MKWTKKQIFSAVFGGLAIAGLVWFCSYSVVYALQQAIEQVK